MSHKIGPRFVYRRKRPLTGKPDCMRAPVSHEVAVRIVALGLAGEPLKNIASELGLSIACVSTRLIRAGLGRRKKTKPQSKTA